MSHPSTTDTTPPYIVAKMQMMKKRMDLMMNALKERVSSDLDDLVHRTDSPFTTSVNSFPLPQKFCMPQIESYDGVNDPLDHPETFKTLMHLQGIADEIICRAFPTTLKGPARIWFSQLTPNSISTFKELRTFLMSIRQREDETLRSYIARFNKEVLSINEADDKILVAAFTNRLRKGKFLFSLYKNDLKTMSEVLYRATKYIMSKMCYWLERKSLGRERGRKTSNRTEGERWQESEMEGMIGALNARRGGSQASPR